MPFIRNSIFLFALPLLLLFSCNTKKSNEAKPVSSANEFTGNKFVYIQKFIMEEEHFIIADSIQFFTGESAAKAFREDKGTEIEESTFYIRNKIIDSGKFKLSPKVKIVAKTFSYNNQEESNLNLKISLKNLTALFKSDKTKYFATLPFKLSIVNGIVETIEEIYIP